MNRGRTRKGEGTATRILTIRLPADHPVWSVPDRERSRAAREWLDYGRDVASVMDAVIREIHRLRDAIENNAPNCASLKAKKAQVDITSFMQL
ncbi:MAG: hypothetical protein ACOYU7_04680 [Bacillota bacterium]